MSDQRQTIGNRNLIKSRYLPFELAEYREFRDLIPYIIFSTKKRIV